MFFFSKKLKYVFCSHKYWNLWNSSLQNFNTFSSSKNWNVIFWSRVWFRHPNLCALLFYIGYMHNQCKKTFIQETFTMPSIGRSNIFANQIGSNSWMSPIWNYMVNGQFPDYEDGARKIKLKSTHYVLVDGEIFRLGISIPLLKCLDDD